MKKQSVSYIPKWVYFDIVRTMPYGYANITKFWWKIRQIWIWGNEKIFGWIFFENLKTKSFEQLIRPITSTMWNNQNRKKIALLTTLRNPFLLKSNGANKNGSTLTEWMMQFYILMSLKHALVNNKGKSLFGQKKAWIGSFESEYQLKVNSTKSEI